MADNTLQSATSGNWLERRFALSSRGSSLRTECLAGVTGFLAAAYMLVAVSYTHLTLPTICSV